MLAEDQLQNRKRLTNTKVPNRIADLPLGMEAKAMLAATQAVRCLTYGVERAPLTRARSHLNSHVMQGKASEVESV